ncbi:MAG: transglycosylase domain-containing protein, partial [Elusimicrobiaceae bacterium]|nr:transglycosylase domain-containing protein [Elusimicrobiaceae bacterium]
MRCWLAFCLLLLPCLCGGEEGVLTPSKTFYDRGGLPLRELLSENHTYYEPVSLDKISPWLLSAVISAEDKRFYTHSGVDVAAVLRATWQNATEGNVVSGASTITQQLARAISPRPKTWWGKTKEALSAVRLEQIHTKEEILEQYFNLLEFGNLTQGAQAASRFYFGVDVADLSLGQAAFLAGLLKSPTYYNPLKHLTRALKRQKYVLDQMHQSGVINDELYALTQEEKIILQAKTRPFYAPHFTQFTAAFVPAGSPAVTTTLDRELQTQVEHALKNQLARLADSNVTNGAVVVLDNATGGVLAYAGSVDFNDKKHSGQVDGVRALRQPGSA